MALRVLHLCQFHFQSQDIRVIGSEVDGGVSLSGIRDVVETSGGGYWQGDWSEGDFGGRSEDERAETLAWRAVNAGLSGGRRVVVRFCDLWHQPGMGADTVSGSARAGECARWGEPMKPACDDRRRDTGGGHAT